jgi:hypothetical protein
MATTRIARRHSDGRAKFQSLVRSGSFRPRCLFVIAEHSCGEFVHLWGCSRLFSGTAARTISRTLRSEQLLPKPPRQSMAAPTK